MKNLQLYVCLLLFAIGHTMLAQNPFTTIRQSDEYHETVSDFDVPTRDTVILDDLIVDGSACIGFDCVNGESFGFDTIRLKENNLRIGFVDTSSTSSFPSNDWEITINDSANGGGNFFGITDIDGGKMIFSVEAGAPANSLYVDDGGRLGLGTNTPVTDIHSKSGNTPTMRLDQDGTSGFTPQTWDIGGNEANFFIRDATNGSTLPFRIKPGSPSNAIYIDAGGEVGFNNSNPIEKIDVEGKIRSRDIIYADNQIGVGTGTPNQFASLEMLAVDKGLLINRLTTAERTTLTGLGLAITEEGLMVYDTDDQTFYVWDGAAWVLGDTDDQALTLNVNSLDLEDGGSVDLTPYLDNTDDQTADVFQLNGNDLELSLEDDGAATQTVDLSGYLDNTDDQTADVFQLNGNDLELSLEDDGVATQTVDLSGYLDNTDDQTADVFQLNGNNLELSLEDDGAATQTVDLSGYLDNTDDQNISGSGLAGNMLTIGIESGASEVVDLSSLDNTGTDDQQLSLAINILELEDGGSVDLSGYLDNTDNQILGNFNLAVGTLLSIGIDNGNVVSVDLSPLLSDLEEENATQQAQIDAQQALIEDLIARMEIREECECTPLLAVDDFNLTRNQAYLSQNIPNPFDNTTSISYFIPLTYSRANIVISTITGQILKNIAITKFGEGSIEVNKERMATAIYYYTLYVDGKKVDTRRMIVE